MTPRFPTALATCLATLAACQGEDMAARQKAASEARRAALLDEASSVLNGWLDEMVRTLPADVKKYAKVKSPLVDWREATFAHDWRRPLQAVVVRARGTPFQEELRAIATFFDTMERFWKKEIDFKDYMAAWKDLKAQVREGDEHSRLVHLLADFDHTFVHVEAFYGAQDMEGDDRAVYFFRHWQVAFDFPREHQEAVSDYLARLCKERLSDYCKTIPFEQMHFAMERPYLAEVQRIARAFLDRYPESPLNRIFEPFLADVAARLDRLEPFAEDPVLPDSKSRAPFVGDVVMTVSRRGLEYEDQVFVDFAKGWEVPAAAWASMARRIAPIQERLEQERGPENLEVLVLAMDRTAPMSIPIEVVTMFRAHPARVVTFGARRRMDGVSRRTVTGRLQFREVPVAPRRVEVEGVGVLKCRPLGQSTDAQDLPERVSSAVVLDPQRLLAGRFAGGKVVDVTPVDDAGAVKILAAGPGLLLVRGDVAYDRFLNLLDPLFIRCADERCGFVRDLTPELEVQGCVR